MKITELKVNEYLEILGSDAPAPGGGAAAGLAGAQGVALVAMVANLTIGKEKFKEYEQHCLDIKAECEKLEKELEKCTDDDVQAYSLFSAAYKLPRTTDEEKAERAAAIAKAAVNATEVPLKTMGLCLEGLKLADAMVGNSNPNIISDIGVGAQNLLSAVKSSWLNVKINLPSLKEEAQKEYFKSEGERIFSEAETLADKVYTNVLAAL